MECEERALSALLVPELITPAQYYDLRHSDGNAEPIKALMMAVLEDAIRCFQNNVGAVSGPARHVRAEAEQWLCCSKGHGPFSFHTVCETLGIEPEYLRAGLLQWRREQLAGNHARRVHRRAPVMRTGRISTLMAVLGKRPGKLRRAADTD